jgi:pSer/pThr/pTyr-binding forkhead associated (FHA) protein
MLIQILLMNGEKRTFSPKDSFILGRSPGCDVVIADAGISRQHCLIEKIGEAVFVTDLGSTNGVFIDGSKLNPLQKTPYNPKSTLSMGPIKSLALDLDQETRLHRIEDLKLDLPDPKILEAQTAPLILELEEKPHARVLPRTKRIKALLRPRQEETETNRLMEILGGLALLIVTASLIWLVS